MKEKKMDYSKKIITIPNILSFFRLCLIPVIIWLYCVKKEYTWTVAALLLSGTTDIVDGFIARKYQMISDLGKILDPVADKLTQLSVLICLLTRFPQMKILVSMLLLKEAFAVISGLMAIYRSKKVMGALWHGKLTTVTLYLVMLVHLVWGNIPHGVSYMSICLCVVVMIMSFFLYAVRNIKAIKGRTIEE